MFVKVVKRLEPLRSLPISARYGISAAFVVAALGIRFALAGIDDDVERLPIYLFFMPAVVLASVLFDSLSGFFATVLSALAAVYFFAEPVHSLAVAQPGNLSGLISFLAIGFIAAFLIESLRGTVDELAQRRDELMKRTRELTQLTEELSAARIELQASNEQRALMLADINHRIKNHLASIAAGLTLSRKGIADPEARDALSNAAARLNVLGRVYTRLHLEGAAVRINADEFLQSLCSDLSASIIGARPIVITASIAPVRLDAKVAANVGLIVNEMVANAVKYAFPDDRSGHIEVALEAMEDGWELRVADNGIGSEPHPESAGAGTKLVGALAAQMKASVDWDRSEGTAITIRLSRKADDR